MVVPKLAPIITGTDWATVMIPALTRLITVAVDALEVKIDAVIPAPLNTPLTGVDFIQGINFLSPSPIIL